jgi:magnesium-transporting ATPase (P-type)
MEKEFIDKYERLLNLDEMFLIHKEDLLSLVDEKNVQNMNAYRHLAQLGGVQGLLLRLDVNPTTGLIDDDQRQMNARRALFGQNDNLLPQTQTFLQCLLHVFKDKVILFLLFAASLRLLVDLIDKKGKWFDYCSIYIVVIVISLIVAVTNYSKEKVFANFQMEIDYKEVRVLRNQTEKLIPKSELLVGDILIVNAGDILPVDGVIIKAYSISIETEDTKIKYHNIHYKQGQNYYQEKFSEGSRIDEYPIILSGSKIVRGYAYVVVLCVGFDTYMNKKCISQFQKRRAVMSSSDASNLEPSVLISLDSRKKEMDQSEINKKRENTLSNGATSPRGMKTAPPSFLKYSQQSGSATKANVKSISEEISSSLSDKETYENTKKDRELTMTSNINSTLSPSNKVFYPLDAVSSFTPLQIKLQSLSLVITKVGVAASLIVFTFFLTTFFIDPQHYAGNSHFLLVVLDAILYGIVLIVVAVPESLPLVVTLSLAFSLNKMREQKTVIKNLEACENLACVDVICTDFTGILTKNDMKVISIFIEDQLIEGRSVSNLREHISQDLFDFFCEGIAINTIAFSAEKKYKIEYLGDPIECGLIRYLRHININHSILRNNILRPIIDCSPYSPDSKMSFTIIEMDEKRDYVRIYVKGSPERLLDLISVYIGEGQYVQQISTKQYEKIKKLCNNIMRDGNFPLIFCYRDIPRDQYNQMRHAYLQKDTEFANNIIRQLTFICLVGIKDELREDVERDIIDCQNAGVIVKMVTSQSKDSARIAAEKCGILECNLREFSELRVDSQPTTLPVKDAKVKNSKYSKNKKIKEKNENEKSEKNSLHTNNSLINNFQVIDAQEDLGKYIIPFQKRHQVSFCSFEFGVSDMKRFNNIIEHALVISRAHAKDKFILAASLKQKGHIVAMTGDGVSDSLAMKTAHVGISMGYHSSDMSKSAADVILMDDNFKSIITAIVYGRNIFDCVRKFLQFQLTATISIISVVLISAFPKLNFYFYPNQLLWMNLILDTLTALCLSSEQPDREVVLNKPPYSLEKSIFTKDMILKITVQSIIQVTLLTSLIFFAPVIFDIPSDMDINYRDWENGNGTHTTIIFNCIIFMQFFNAFVSRTLDSRDMNIFRNILSNKVFLIMEPLIILSQLFIISHGGRITRTRPLDVRTNVCCLLISSIVLLTLPMTKYLGKFRKVKDDRVDTSSEE